METNNSETYSSLLLLEKNFKKAKTTSKEITSPSIISASKPSVYIIHIQKAKRAIPEINRATTPILFASLLTLILELFVLVFDLY